MNKHSAGWLALVALAAASAMAPAAEFAWQTDLEAARLEAARDGKPLCIVFR
jgi:hypothetical protein